VPFAGIEVGKDQKKLKKEKLIWGVPFQIARHASDSHRFVCKKKQKKTILTFTINYRTNR
jgi:predicted RNA-binding protein